MSQRVDTEQAGVAEEAGDDAISDLRRRYDELTHSQKRIAELIVDDPEFVTFATVDKFAARLGVSPSTIVRFAYRIGLAGYPELQEQVRRKFMKGLRTSEQPGGGGATSHLGTSIAATSLQHDLDILAKTVERADTADIEQAISLLVQAPRVRVIGGLTSFSLAHFTGMTLDRVRPGVIAVNYPVPSGVLLDLAEGDALLAFSFTPYASATAYAIDIAKARGAAIIAVTDSPIAPLQDKADVLLPVVVSGIGMQNSLVAAMALANVIVNGVTAQIPGALDRYSETLGVLSGGNAYRLDSGKDD